MESYAESQRWESRHEPCPSVLCLYHQEPWVMLWALEKYPQVAELSSSPTISLAACLCFDPQNRSRMRHGILNGHKQFRKRLELNVLEEIYMWKHIWESDDAHLGCVWVLWFLLQRTASDRGLRQMGRIPQQPCVCKRGFMDHRLLKPSSTAQWAPVEHDTA